MDLSKLNNKIVGGSEVEPGSLPYMVAIFMNNTNGENKFHCGGTVISSHHVLTATHCVTGDRFTVVAGAHNLTAITPIQVTVGVAEVTVHELFYWFDNSAIPVNDIALLRVAEPLVLGSGVDALKVPEQDQDSGDDSLYSGWLGINTGGQEGGPLSSVLMSTEIPVVEQQYCIDSYGLHITPTMMCAGYPLGQYDACGGDSGGPLVCDGLLQGIMSWGEGCGQSVYFGVYTRVAFFSDWIEKHNYIPQ
ncbi:hypothetical protein Pmani_003602 [Petrolisthes manimaculis]|uniref:Peptidase S1 domain-containing protein n=1 Tax=Petrolisthes manimaculis TaxID=1843537 RepID=A0AAE1QI77_9EUCA|nr:hypothetical protein Pmani_003602 [Petrolisthes manimaculis]